MITKIQRNPIIFTIEDKLHCLSRTALPVELLEALMVAENMYDEGMSEYAAYIVGLIEAECKARDIEIHIPANAFAI